MLNMQDCISGSISRLVLLEAKEGHTRLDVDNVAPFMLMITLSLSSWNMCWSCIYLVVFRSNPAILLLENMEIFGHFPFLWETTRCWWSKGFIWGENLFSGWFSRKDGGIKWVRGLVLSQTCRELIKLSSWRQSYHWRTLQGPSSACFSCMRLW